jgi:hypothetical protein
MADGSDIPLLDHQLADDELAWADAIYQDFSRARAAFAGREAEFNPKETLRQILAKPEHQLPDPIDISGDGIWRGGRNRHGRFAACVFLKSVELHRHPFSRTDQFAMYVNGEADAYSEDADGQPLLTPVTGGQQFHNPPGAPHAFLPKVGEPIPDDWEIAFIAITPRNLREDTHAVSSASKAAYTQVSGREAPAHV